MIKLQTLEPYGINGINEYQRIIAKNGLHRMFEIGYYQKQAGDNKRLGANYLSSKAPSGVPTMDSLILSSFTH